MCGFPEPAHHSDFPSGSDTHDPADAGSRPGYVERVAAETSRFSHETHVHDLPRIFHYWSNTYLLPKLQHFGASSIDEYFVNAFDRVITALGSVRPARLASLGAGNCDTEVRVAQALLARGHSNFSLECLEITDAMVERGRKLAAAAGVAAQVIPVQVDLNRWEPRDSYDALVANQSLHHVVHLERLCATAAGALSPGGLVVVSDMIGRNGHQRWPEALSIVREFWAELPDSYRYHLQLQRHEPEFRDWDCSFEGFEGIRSQDVLPTLSRHFEFEEFLAFANVIDPFIDRGFGPHFDPDREWDRDFIDRVHLRDEVELMAGTITPTHLIGTLRAGRTGATPRCWRNLTPEFCVRHPE